MKMRYLSPTEVVAAERAVMQQAARTALTRLMVATMEHSRLAALASEDSTAEAQLSSTSRTRKAAEAAWEPLSDVLTPEEERAHRVEWLQQWAKELEMRYVSLKAAVAGGVVEGPAEEASQALRNLDSAHEVALAALTALDEGGDGPGEA